MVRNKSSILVVSIWLLVIFSVFAVGLSKICISQINVARRIHASNLSFSGMLGLCNLLQWEITKDSTNYDTLHEFSGQSQKELGSLKIKYILIDEESKLNVNTAPQKFLKDLPGIDDDIAVEITTSPLRPYKAKEELLLLDTIDEEVFSEIAPFITVKSNSKININTASPEVFESLNFDKGLIDTIISFREGPDGEEGTLDDSAFKSQGSIIEVLEDYRGLSDSWKQQLRVALGWFTVGGGNFSVSAQTEVLGRYAFRYDIILTNNKILRWKEE
mgnify:CR=1 FL=1